MSDGFSATWLSLREPFDARARDRALVRRLRDRLSHASPCHVVDLGAGTGANLRWLAPRLGVPQHWTLVEHDPALIEAGERRLAEVGVSWRYARRDLARDLEGLSDTPAALVTASALIDLVSAAWLARLVALCRRLDALLYIGLTFDGRIVWRPEDGDDAVARRHVLRHQRGEKGFGPALGPDAAPALARLLGEGAMLQPSDWCLGPNDAALQQALLDGYEAAAVAIGPADEGTLRAWADRRRRLIQDGASSLTVGHLDLLWLAD